VFYIRRPQSLSSRLPHSIIHCSDTVGARTLEGLYSIDATGNTVETCVAKCNAAGFFYAGLEYGHVLSFSFSLVSLHHCSKECFCGNSLENGGTPAPLPDCLFSCPGNSAEKCGTDLRLSLYSKGGTPYPGHCSLAVHRLLGVQLFPSFPRRAVLI